jgi:hypothetical protein
MYPVYQEKPVQFGRTLMLLILGFLGLTIFFALPIAIEIFIAVVVVVVLVVKKFSSKVEYSTTSSSPINPELLLTEKVNIPEHLVRLRPYFANLQKDLAAAQAKPPGNLPAQEINVSTVIWKYRAAVSELTGAVNSLGAVVADDQTSTYDLDRVFTGFASPIAIIVNAKQSLWECQTNPQLRQGRDLLHSLLQNPLQQMSVLCQNIEEVFNDPDGTVRRYGSLTIHVRVSFSIDEDQLSDLQDWAERMERTHKVVADALWQ